MVSEGFAVSEGASPTAVRLASQRRAARAGSLDRGVAPNSDRPAK